MWPKYLLLLLLLSTIHRSSCTQDDSSTNNAPDSLKMPTTAIGGIFDSDGFMRRSFSLAIRAINECVYNRDLCDAIKPCEAGVDCNRFHRIQFNGYVYEIEDHPLSVYRKLEEFMSQSNPSGISTLIGPHGGITSSFIQGFCELHDLPNIVIRREIEHDRLRSINLYPDTETLASIYVRMVRSYNWTDFSIIYESTERYIALDNVLKMYEYFDYKAVLAFRLDFGSNYTRSLLAAKESKHTSFIVDCSHEILSEVLKQTQQVGMMTDKYRFIVTSMDLQTIDLSPYVHSGVKISGLRLIDPHDPFVSKFVNSHLDDFNITSVEKLSVDEALMFDAVTMFTLAYKDLTYEYDIKDLVLMNHDLLGRWDKGPSERSLKPTVWYYGLSLRNYMLYNDFSGLTGHVMLDSDGLRRRFKVDILDLHKTGLTKVGHWSPDDGFDELHLEQEMSNVHFRVLITMNPPYAMKVNFSKSLEGNDRYEGFVVDIIKELSDKLGFNYTFYVQENSQNGECNKTESHRCICTGMMKKIVEGEMDLAITDLTITKERQICVDFSTAFMNLGMSILFKKPMKAPTTLFSFLSPFHNKVWIYLGGTYCCVSLLFYVLGRLSPQEWTNPYPCLEEPDELHNQFTLGNAFWFTMGAIMQQGSEIAPVSVSTRTLAGCWWFFCLIMVSSYTANLAAFLTVESPVKVVRGIDDLFNQTKIKYGAKKGGSTFMYFKNSKTPAFRALAEQMMAPEWDRYMVTDNEKGVELAQTENYAFLMESSSIEYIQYRKCELEQAGPLIDQKSYAIAYRKDFNWSKSISLGISELQEKLELKKLYEKWWMDKGATCFSTSETTAEPMNLDQLRGIFVVLAIGLLISCIFTMFEFSAGVVSQSNREQVKFVTALKEEVRQVTKNSSTKPVLRKQRSSESNLSEVYSCDTVVTTQF